MSHEPFAQLDVSTLVVKKPRANEKSAGKSAYVDRTIEGLPTLFTTQKESKLLWPIRPGTADGAVRENERLNIEISVSEEEEQKARECDEKFLTSLYEMKVDFFGSKAKNITSKEVIKPMYKNLLREGATAKDGTQYANSFRMKVDGWAAYIKNVNIIEKVKDNGEKMKLVKDCDWSERLVEDNDRNAPSDRDTRFYLFLGTNPVTQKARYADKVVCVDASGKPIQKGEKDGKPIYQMRYVGPQDAVPGCTLTVVWSLNKLYITETTGPTSAAKDVYIKPQIQKNKAVRKLHDVEVEDSVDASETAAVLHSMRAEDDEIVPLDEPVHAAAPAAAAQPAAQPAAQAVAEPIAAVQPTQESIVVPAQDHTDRKRKAADASSSSSKKRTVVVEEDF